MSTDTFNNNMLFALDDLKKAIEVIKTKVQELEAAATIIDTTRFLAATDGLKEEARKENEDAIRPDIQA